MKLKLFLTTVIIMACLSNYQRINAQPGNDGREHKSDEFSKNHDGSFGFQILNLTEEQKSKIKTLRLEHFKEIQPFRNHLGELKAKERTLTSAEKADMNAINSNIDEITKTQNQMMKLRARHHQQVRELLTEEQRIYFDLKWEQIGNRFHDGNFQRANKGQMHKHEHSPEPDGQ